MTVIWALLVLLGSTIACFASLGSIGVGNLLLLVGDAAWKTHLKVWAGSVLAFTVVVVLMPQTIYTQPDLHFSDERAICTLYDAPWVC